MNAALRHLGQVLVHGLTLNFLICCVQLISALSLDLIPRTLFLNTIHFSTGAE